MNPSSPISEDEVRHVAKLSRLRLSDEEVRRYTAQLGHVLDYIARLNELDVSDVEPMAHAMDVTNVLRPDQPQPGLPVDKVLANAPQQAPPFFRVPKVLADASGA